MTRLMRFVVHRIYVLYQWVRVSIDAVRASPHPTRYLDGLDHFVKRELKIAGYLRYMDDFVLFGEREAALCDASERIRDWLASQRRLILKDPDARPVSNQRPAVFLGFRLSRAGIGPGPKARARLRRRLRRIGGGDSEHLARSLQAYRGMWRALGGK